MRSTPGDGFLTAAAVAAGVAVFASGRGRPDWAGILVGAAVLLTAAGLWMRGWE
jgi:hypothetical protein